MADGTFDSLNNLKASNMQQYSSIPSYKDALETKKHLMNLNTIWANILHKGHNKDPELNRSWRTIS